MMSLGMFTAALALFAPAAPAPVLAPIDEAGFQKLVAAHKGKVVLYDFWATWCAPCRAETPALVQLDKKLGAGGFVLVTISADEPENAARAAKMAAEAGVPRPAYQKVAKDDDAFINSIDHSWNGALPAMFLYDKAGRRVRSFIGATDTATIEKAVKALL